MPIYEKLNVALAAHKRTLELVERVAKSSTEVMQILLIIDLDQADKKLASWIEAAPVNALIHHGEGKNH